MPPVAAAPPVAAIRSPQAVPQTMPRAAPAARPPERTGPPPPSSHDGRARGPARLGRSGGPGRPACSRRPRGPVRPAGSRRCCPRPAAPAAGAVPSPGTARPAPAASRFGLTVVAGTTRGQRYKLPVTGCVVGRNRGAILLPDDTFVSALHATFLVKDGRALRPGRVQRLGRLRHRSRHRGHRAAHPVQRGLAAVPLQRPHRDSHHPARSARHLRRARAAGPGHLRGGGSAGGWALGPRGGVGRGAAHHRPGALRSSATPRTRGSPAATASSAPPPRAPC